VYIYVYIYYIQELDVAGGEHNLDDEQVEETSSQDENKLSFSRTWSRKCSFCPTVGDNTPTLMHFRKSSHRNSLGPASLPVLLEGGRGEAEGGGGGESDIEQRTGGSIASQQVLDLLQQHQSQLHHQNQQHRNTQQQLSNLETLMSKVCVCVSERKTERERCVCACMQVYIHPYIYIYVNVGIYIYICICIFIERESVCVCVCVDASIYVYVCIYTYMYTVVVDCVVFHVCIHTYIYIYIDR